MKIEVKYIEQPSPEIEAREIVIEVVKLSFAARFEYFRLLREGIAWYTAKYNLEYGDDIPDTIAHAESDRTYLTLRAEMLCVIRHTQEGPTRKYHAKLREGKTGWSDFLLPESWTNIETMLYDMPVDLFDELSVASRTLNQALFPSSATEEDDPFLRVSSKVVLS